MATRKNRIVAERGAADEKSAAGGSAQSPIAVAPAAIAQVVKIAARDYSFYYGRFQALHAITLTVPEKVIMAIIGPTRSGKSTFLRSVNRLNDETPGTRHEGRLEINGVDINGPKVDPAMLRRKIGMIFSRPNPFPRSVFDNVAYGLKINRIGGGSRSELADRVSTALETAGLWGELRDRLNEPALNLSAGQQQRLCIARALAVEPDVLLLDEPTSTLDPIASQKIEDVIFKLKGRCTVLIVSHNMQQAARVSDTTAFFWLGKLVEVKETEQMFTNPEQRLTEDYITGRFG